MVVRNSGRVALPKCATGPASASTGTYQETASSGAFYRTDGRARICRCFGRLLSGSESNRLVNSEGGVNQRFGEFWTEILGFGRNRGGSFRDLVQISRKGEFPARAGIDVNPCRKGVKRKTPGGRNLGVGR